MRDVDRQGYVARYEGRLAEFGASPQTLGWGTRAGGRQAVRFDVVLDLLGEVGATSVLDVGCGFADLHDHLRAAGWQGTYRGIDIVGRLLDVARERDPAITVTEADIADHVPSDPDRFDVVVACGAFNWTLEGERNADHIRRSVTRMFALARRAVCVDFLSTHVDYRQPGAWHTDPAWALELARGLSRRFRLRHDYMPYEYALVVYRDDDGGADHVFRPPGAVA
jgi:SAM-dependent methyltransferase